MPSIGVFSIVRHLRALFAVVGSSGLAVSAYDGVYNSSTTPASLPWNTYNYCNAPHVNAAHYAKPTNVEGAELVYMNVMMRHHKRTPDNLLPNENEFNPSTGWNCAVFKQFSYGGGATDVFHETYIPASHPFLYSIWNGTCDAGQLTQQGLEDSIKHGKDFWSVYHGKLGFVNNPTKDFWLRTSTEIRTHQVASGLLYGMDPSTATVPHKVYTQPENIDSLVPNYPCPAANDIRAAYQSVPAWTDHLAHHAALKARLDATLGTAGLADWASWYDHFFDAFTSRTCNGHTLPCNSTGSCVSQEDADTVHALGDFEYNYIWNAAVNASDYNQLTFGVMFSELASNFKSFKAGAENVKVRFYVGHDGSLVRLAAGLKATPLRWPAMGSEIVMEVWRTRKNDHFVRVLHEGTPLKGLEWVGFDGFVGLLDAQVPHNISGACQG
ncbi:hypothetical protein PLICRDRAFT_101602 [Plicaturopsis crispa FD-325 SS-3]|nr:hypothetical protein PLICRDRAFT_101602 [Plicaturopsis crispa FD-325 SS-3]